MVIAEFFGNITGIITVSLIFGMPIIIAVVSTLAKNWRKVHESEHAAALKQSMIERGMSADEIERVLRAGPVTGASEATPAADQSTELAGHLAEHKVAAPTLGSILAEYRKADPATRKIFMEMIVHMLDSGAKGDQVLSALQAMSNTQQASAPRFSDSPASFRN
jgi:hypothetical protein